MLISPLKVTLPSTVISTINNLVPVATQEPVALNVASKEAVQEIYRFMRVAQSFADFYNALPDDLKGLARASPRVIDDLYGHFRWYEKSHAEVRGFAPKVAEEVDLDCAPDNNEGFSAMISEPVKHESCKAKIAKAQKDIYPAMEIEEDCGGSVPDELRIGCHTVCGFYQGTQRYRNG